MLSLGIQSKIVLLVHNDVQFGYSVWNYFIDP